MGRYENKDTSLYASLTDKEVFDRAVNYFKNNTMIVKFLGYDSSFYKTAEIWWPRNIDEKDESHFNPVSVMETVTIPCYLVYGKKDTQIDLIQAMQAYKVAFAKSGNK